MEVRSAPQEQRRRPGMPVSGNQNFSRQQSLPSAPQNPYHASQMEGNRGHEQRYPPPDLVQYRQYLSHLKAATSDSYRQMQSPIPTVPYQSGVPRGSEQAPRVPAFTASTTSTATGPQMGAYHHHRSASHAVPRDVLARQSHIKPEAHYPQNAKVAAASSNMAAPTLMLPRPHRTRLNQQSQDAPMPTPAMTPHPSTPPACRTEPLGSSVSTVDGLHRQTISEGLQRLETLERTLDTLSGRAVATDQAQSSALAGLDRRLCDLERKLAEQQRFNDLSRSSELVKTRNLGALDTEPVVQDTRQILVQAMPEVAGVDNGVEDSIKVNVRRDSPTLSDRGTLRRPDEGRREIRKRYDLRRRSRKQR